jgi:flagellar motility protein MotE (MotC chaperone)
MGTAVSSGAPRQRRLRQRWVLTLIGFLFAASGILRLGTMEFAWANVEAPTPEPVAGAPPSPRIETTRALQDALAEIAGLRADLDVRAAALADREQAVAAAQSLVEDRLAELAAAEARLEALIATSDTAAETDLDRLTRVYEAMPPETAAALFEQMPPSFAAGFIARMTPPAGAALMGALRPEHAYAVSVVLATRNSSAPRLDGVETVASDTER